MVFFIASHEDLIKFDIVFKTDSITLFMAFHTFVQTVLIASSVTVIMVLYSSNFSLTIDLIASAIVLKNFLIPSHMDVNTFLTPCKKLSQKPLKLSQLSYISLKAPAIGLTKNKKSPCQLFLIKSITDENTSFMPFHTFENTSFTPSHRLIQNSLKPSHLFHSVTNIAISPAIAATTKAIGFAANTANKADAPPVIVEITPPNAGSIDIIVPIADMTFPTIIKTGPTAATISPIFTISSFV